MPATEHRLAQSLTVVNTDYVDHRDARARNSGNGWSEMLPRGHPPDQKVPGLAVQKGVLDQVDLVR